MGLDVCGQLCRSWSYIANVNVVASLLFSWYKCAQSCKKPKRTVVIWYLTRTKGFSTRSVCYDWHRSQVVTSKALRIRRTIDGFQGRESFVIILDLVRTEDLGLLEQEPRATVALSKCRDSFIIVGNKALIEKENFENWKDTKKTSDGIQVDNPKSSVIWYIEELAKRDLVTEQEEKAHAKQSLQKSSELAEENTGNGKGLDHVQAQPKVATWKSATDEMTQATVTKSIANQTTPYNLSELKAIIKGATMYSV